MVHPGPALRQIRKAQKKTLADLEAVLDQDTGNLSRKERGMEDISVDMLTTWCAFLNVRPSEVYSIAESGIEGLAKDLGKIAGYLGKLSDVQRQVISEQVESLATKTPVK